MKLIIMMLLVSSMNLYASTKDQVEEVRELVKSSYANGAYNKLDTQAMRNGFHYEFSIFSSDGEDIRKYTIEDWIAGIEARKEDSEFDINNYSYDYKFRNIDVTAKSATVKIEFSKNGNMIYTDYLLLLKFTSSWKIVSKVYHAH